MSRECAPSGSLAAALSAIRSPWRIEPEHPLTAPPAQFTPPQAEAADDEFRKNLSATRKKLRPLQRRLFAQREYAVLLVFQALDAGGKDGAIREVLQGLDPIGINVASFKRPTKQELAHDFLWRTARELPERGCITAFNRSHYEEVLAVRVHPEYLTAQFRGAVPPVDDVWPERFRAIREHERHLAASNTVILKFWLNVSPERQARRFLSRLEDPSRQWKFALHDLEEAALRAEYDRAIMDAMNETSRPWAPWFSIPADDRWYLRWQIADIVLQALNALPLSYPEPEHIEEGERERLAAELRRRSGD